MVRAKFIVDSVSKTRFGMNSVRLAPVCNGSEENKEFFKWTPGGSIELQVVNDETAAKFEPGKEYYVDFSPAEKDE